MDEQEFTAKDFRTWGATLCAFEVLLAQPCVPPVSERAFSRCVVATARVVAGVLGNTAAVCRRSYINPAVFALWRSGRLKKLASRRPAGKGYLEGRALKLLSEIA